MFAFLRVFRNLVVARKFEKRRRGEPLMPGYANAEACDNKFRVHMSSLSGVTYAGLMSMREER